MSYPREGLEILGLLEACLRIWALYPSERVISAYSKDSYILFGLLLAQRHHFSAS